MSYNCTIVKACCVCVDDVMSCSCAVAETVYEVEVETGEKWGSGTDARPFIVLQGERGDSGRRILRKNKEGGDMFESGKVRVEVTNGPPCKSTSTVIVTRYVRVHWK